MSVPDRSRKAFVSVVEMADLLNLSKSRFYVLIHAGIFPQPVLHQGCKRPVFSVDLQQKCLEIRRTGIGANGQPVLFNRKSKAVAPKQSRSRVPDNGESHDLIKALNSLGLKVSSELVARAITELYPNGYNDTEKGEVVRQLFLHLQPKS